MSKPSSIYICQQCNYQSSSFIGKCPECGEWNSLVETVVSQQQTANSKQQEINIVKLSGVKSQELRRVSTGFVEFDRVLGGGPPAGEAGIVPGSIVLVAGDPGIGKSTLLLQCAMRIASSQFTVHSSQKKKKAINSERSTDNQHSGVLYVSGEESAQQIKIRADRLVHSSQSTVDSGRKSVIREPLTDNLYILPQTGIEAIIDASQRLKPNLLIIDSIQTLLTGDLTGVAGSVGQVRQCAQILQRYAKESQTAVFVVGHVTKEGNIAGPKVLEHIVDAVLNLEGDGMHTFRLLRSVKNRFGSTFEVGVFEMRDSGMVEVANPSQIFLAQRVVAKPGSVVTSTIAGGRPILAEVQALCTSTIFGIPMRRVTGLDFARIQVVIAALTRAAKIPVASLDIYVNVAGGLKINEPAADLPAALAIVSAAVDKPIREGICAFGEVGLLGEIRTVTNSKNRIAEAKRLGFEDFVTPERFKTLEEAVGYAIHGG